MIFKHRTVPVIGSAFGYEDDLRTRGAADVRVRVTSSDAEFLDRIHRGPQHARECKAVVDIVIVDAVYREVSLVTARASYRAVAAVKILIDAVIGRPGVSHARLQAQQVLGAPVLD